MKARHGHWPARLGAAALAFALLLQPTMEAAAQQVGPESGLPLPRFVSLKSREVNVRVGPGSDYPIAWTFVRFGLPVEITQEFDNWRRVRDWEGNEGWVLWNLLAGDRTAIVLAGPAGEPLDVHSDASADATVTARLEPGVVTPVDRCQDGWCRLIDSRFNGWVEQERLWGVYPDETFN